jgi:hypothetical protein
VEAPLAQTGILGFVEWLRHGVYGATFSALRRLACRLSVASFGMISIVEIYIEKKFAVTENAILLTLQCSPRNVPIGVD